MPNSTRRPAVTAGAPTAAASATPAAGPAVAVTAPGDETDPRWWVAPLAATVVAPLLSFLVAVRADLFTALPVFLIGGFVLPLALVVPGWCLARTRRRRQARINLAALACLLAVAYPALIGGIGVAIFVVMLLTGNIHS
ncbi:hypothetical protein [Streptomyces zaomyceticus]|uniref:hypothetical protein n=1 Tax=Streptomyces zaomyceticus TaxID=68286 RepID=UPI0016762531|nr:hypothetical protein [Streptomyces zaomyceticus]GHG34079.1 hypothetical protein GCM10018791_59180 [Streptomyces zaomyceticus]